MSWQEALETFFGAMIGGALVGFALTALWATAMAAWAYFRRLRELAREERSPGWKAGDTFALRANGQVVFFRVDGVSETTPGQWELSVSAVAEVQPPGVAN